MSQPSQANPERPWLGLARFTEADQDYFYGRDREIAELRDRVLRSPLTVLYGVSGYGKSSLLGAGLIPSLKAEGFLPIPLPRFVFDDPTRPLFSQAIDIILNALPHPDSGVTIGVNNFMEMLCSVLPKSELANARKHQSLWEFFHDRTLAWWQSDHAHHIQPVLIFDQFEDFFTQGEDKGGNCTLEARQFLQNIADLVENRPPAALREALKNDRNLVRAYDFQSRPVKVVIALREDFLSRLERWRRVMPSVVENRLELRLLTGPQALQAVLRPSAKRVDLPPILQETTGIAIVRFVAGVTEDVPLEEIDNVPPLLSLICEQLNERRFANLQTPASLRPDLPLDWVQKTGNTAVSELTAAEEVLEQFYRSSFDEHPEAVRQFVEDALVSDNGFRETITLDSAQAGLQKAGIANPQNHFYRLVDQRILTIEDRGGKSRVELTHDILARLALKSRIEREKEVLALKHQEEARLALEKEKREEEISRRFARQSSQSDFLLASHYAEKNPARALAQIARALRSDPENHAAEALGWSLANEFPICRLALLHANTVNYANFSPDGTTIVTASSDHTVVVWETVTGNPLAEPLQHPAKVRFAEYSPNGKYLATICEDDVVRIWNLDQGNLLLATLHHAKTVNTVSFSPDSSHVVTTLGGPASSLTPFAVFLWNVNSGERVGRALHHIDKVNSASFNHDGTRIVSASNDRSARVWDTASGRQGIEDLEHREAVISAKFSPNGALIVTASADCTARIWDSNTGKPKTPLLQHYGAVNSAIFSPDGTKIVTASADTTAQIWDVSSGKALSPSLLHDRRVLTADFSSEGCRILTVAEDFAVRVWSVDLGRPLAKPLPHTHRVNSAFFSPTENSIITASEDAAKIWNLAPPVPLSNPLSHNGEVNHAAFSADGTRIVTASDDGVASVWDVSSCRPMVVFSQEEQAILWAEFSPDGTSVTTSGQKVQIWDALTGELKFSLLKHKSQVVSARYNYDGTLLVTASHDRTARIWDSSTGNELTPPLQHKSRVISAIFSLDGRLVVTASADNTARIWEALTGAPVVDPMRHEGRVNFACFSPDGTCIVTASQDFTARIWDAKNGSLITVLSAHKAGLSSVSFSPDATRIVTASDDHSAIIWNIHGVQLTEPLRHQGPVHSAVFSPDSTRIVTASDDGTARVWDANSGLQLTLPFRHSGYVYLAGFTPDGNQIITASQNGEVRIWDTAYFNSPAPDWVQATFDRLCGLHLPEGSNFCVKSPDGSISDIQNIRSGKETDDRSFLFDWMVTAPISRAISPFSTQATTDYVERRLISSTLESIHEASQIDPLNPSLLLAKVQLTKTEEAAEYLWQYAINHSEKSPARIWSQLSGVLLTRGKLNAAERSARQAIKLDPTMASAHWNLGRVLWEKQNWDESIAAAEESLRIEPDNTSRWINKNFRRAIRNGNREDLNQWFLRYYKLQPALAKKNYILNLGLTSSEILVLEQVRRRVLEDHPELIPDGERLLKSFWMKPNEK